MPPAASPRPKPPRTQAERRAGTQRALLDATVDCLAELGYANTSTTEVARRAGVSRGAQTHHYPTKSALVVAAIEHVFAERERSFVESFTNLAPQDRTLDRAVVELWEILRGPAYQAILELVTAARTDPELQVVVHGVAARFEQTILELFTELFPELSDPDVAAATVGLAFATLQGAAVSGYAGLHAGSDLAIDALRRLARLGPDVLRSVLQHEPTEGDPA